jgi:hypothetical protein
MPRLALPANEAAGGIAGQGAMKVIALIDRPLDDQLKITVSSRGDRVQNVFPGP